MAEHERAGDHEEQVEETATTRHSGIRPQRRASLTRPPEPESAQLVLAYERFARAAAQWIELRPVSETPVPRLETERPGARLDAGERWFVLTPVSKAGMQQPPRGEVERERSARPRRKSTKDFEAPDAEIIDLDSRRSKRRK
jgi:hypothetical protein